MSYLLHATKKRNRNGLKKILFILLVCLVLGFFVRGFIIRSIVGVGTGIESIVSFIVPSGFRFDATVIAENESLRREVLRLTSENVDRNVLATENANLKFQLGRKDAGTSTKTTTKVKGILAIIKQRPAETPYDTFVLDIGMSNGVVIGDNVYYGNLVIGKIIDVGDEFSKAELYSSPDNSFAGVIAGSKIKADAKGLGGGLFESLVPEGANINVGDALILPSIQSKVFGVIKSIEDRPTEGFKRLLFALPVNPNQINNVLVGK